MSYTNTTLTQAIKDYTENDETTFTTNIPNFIKNAEERILKLVELDYFRKNVTGNLTNGNKFLAVPSDYLGAIALSIINSSNHEFLLFKDVSFIREAYPVGTTEGIPKHYAVFDENSFILGPTPNANLTAELHYFYKPESITASSDGTSWLGTNAESTLLYGCLVEAYTFLKGDPDMLNLYTARYEDALGKLKTLGEGYSTTDSYRSGSVRVGRQ